MNGIIGMSELLLGTELDESQEEFAVAVRRSAESLLAIINEILDLSKIEAGRVTLQERGFAVGSYHSFASLVAGAEKRQTPETPNVLAIEVLGEVSAGDRVVVRGNERLQAGQDVSIMDS